MFSPSIYNYFRLFDLFVLFAPGIFLEFLYRGFAKYGTAPKCLRVWRVDEDTPDLASTSTFLFG